MIKFLKDFAKEERGSVVEYILVLAVVAVIMALAFPALRRNLMEWFSQTMGEMNQAFDGEGCDLSTHVLEYDATQNKHVCNPQ